jgi:hypothetical protein
MKPKYSRLDNFLDATGIAAERLAQQRAERKRQAVQVPGELQAATEEARQRAQVDVTVAIAALERAASLKRVDARQLRALVEDFWAPGSQSWKPRLEAVEAEICDIEQQIAALRASRP